MMPNQGRIGLARAAEARNREVLNSRHVDRHNDGDLTSNDGTVFEYRNFCIIIAAW